MTRKIDDLLTTKMAADLLEFTPCYIRRLISQGRIKAEKFGNGWVMSARALF